MATFDRHMLRKALAIARRRGRALLRTPRVAHATPTMQPGAMRLGADEEEAAVAAVREVMRSRRLFRAYGVTGNPFERSRVAEFERAFAAHVGSRHALALNSGTSALVAALVALGIGPGDEVIVPAYTWVSTAGAVLEVGAVPIIAEVDASLNLDPADVRNRISPYTRAIIAVHMRGAPAALDALLAIAREHGLRVIEDVAQAAGGSFGGRALGSIGDAGAFSFQQSKTITAGEGGALTTDDDALAQRAAIYHDSAICPHRGVALDAWRSGINLRMSELHAAVLQVQLARLDSIVADMRARKRTLRARLEEPLARCGATLRTLNDPAGETGLALIFFVPEAARVARLVSALRDENIPAAPLWQDMKYLPRDHIDLHVYAAWAPILEQRSWFANGAPWRSHPRKITYSAEMCPRSLALLARAVQIDVSPELDATQLEQLGDAIADVTPRLL